MKPADERYAGRYLAGFAPLGKTGFVVFVQTRAEDAMGTEITLAIRLIQGAGIAIAPGVLMVFVAAGFGRRRRIHR